MARKQRKHRLWRALGALLILAVVCFGGLVGFVLVQENRVESEATALAKDYDAIIVLGAQVLLSGEPNTQLQWRLDAAKQAWDAKQVPIVVCGAQGADEPISEAEAMRNYLTRAGVPEEMIYLDPNSFNTNENLRNAGEILKTLPEVRKVVIVTSDYHVPRAMALARDFGFEATGLGSPCKPEYWLKNHAREALAWVKYWMTKYLGFQGEWPGKFPS
ncbi:MAG: YdcF family protein [Clostridia bacterium]|nr:YdcF family protein [Clostridia bacterium]